MCQLHFFHIPLSCFSFISNLVYLKKIINKNFSHTQLTIFSFISEGIVAQQIVREREWARNKNRETDMRIAVKTRALRRSVERERPILIYVFKRARHTNRHIFFVYCKKLSVLCWKSGEIHFILVGERQLISVKVFSTSKLLE